MYHLSSPAAAAIEVTTDDARIPSRAPDCQGPAAWYFASGDDLGWIFRRWTRWSHGSTSSTFASRSPRRQTTLKPDTPAPAGRGGGQAECARSSEREDAPPL